MSLSLFFPPNRARFLTILFSCFQIPLHLGECDTSLQHNGQGSEAVFHIIPQSIQLSHHIMQIRQHSLRTGSCSNHMPESGKIQQLIMHALHPAYGNKVLN